MTMTTEEARFDPARSGKLRPSRDKAGSLIPLGHNHPLVVANFQVWIFRVPSEYAFEDLLAPEFWRNVELSLQVRSGRPAVGDFIRAIDVNGTYDVFLAIQEVARGYKLAFSHGRLPDGAA